MLAFDIATVFLLLSHHLPSYPLLGVHKKHTDIVAEYEALVAAENLQYNREQLKVVKQLKSLQESLRDYQPHSPSVVGRVSKNYLCISVLYQC